MDLEKNLTKAKAELVQHFGETLESLVLFGSAVGSDYIPGVSDVNLLLVLKRVDMSTLDTLKQFIKKMSGARFRAPLVMTKEHLTTSLDVFPIEFLEIKERYRVLVGEDVFSNAKIDTTHLRHECEHELKGRLMRIRHSYMEVRDSAAEYKQLILSAHAANFPAFRTALRLKQVVPPTKKEEVAAALAVHFSLDQELFHTLKRLRLNEIKLDVAGLRDLIERYLIEVEKIAAIIDRL